MNKKLQVLVADLGKDTYNYPLSIVFIIFSIFLTTLIAFMTGGSNSSLHLLYIPLFFSVLVFGIKGGIITAVVAGLAVGPYLPINSANNIMQPPAMWLFRIGIFIVIVVFVGSLIELIKKTEELEKRKAYEDLRTGYYNFNKFKLDLWTMVSSCKYQDISVIMFEFQNIDMIKRYVDVETSQKSFVELLDKAEKYFEDGTIYAATSKKITVILPEWDAWEAAKSAKDFIATTKKPVYIDNFPISIVVKGAVINYPKHETDGDRLIVKLDKAIEQCLRCHSEVVIYDDIIEIEQEKYYSGLVSLYHSLQNDMFTLAYQPKIDLKNNSVIGVEALLRWKDKDKKSMSISELIRRAEEAGFINQITRWVIKNTAMQMKRWDEKGIIMPVSINLSAKELSDDTFVEYVRECLDEYGVNPNNLEFELTERIIILDEKNALEQFRKLKKMGIKMSLDDYGSGFNSAKYLMEYGEIFDYLKIEKKLIDKISNEKNFAIIKCMINATHLFGMKLVAEGVETISQVELLKSADCDYIQGFYYSKPLFAEDLEQFLQKQNL
ncbi:EAL domain-containing protein [Sedimentibacter saalensis]|uniref:EAL domain-containing protein (Putative c-di-GMP-specific phosphodiesterase class I) n=1 Tax=Sedimentibacter saalensis TaxID=130788 RepID=A0A562J8F9_9FIRM|nr:EAL domain-containing protein [Sedimentibacter saalensis]TWH79350.1 EAL domain-containing protein (putative c-di-GMP-specific phosphodiesterase class I) [Sedimentibacter saalensis]